MPLLLGQQLPLSPQVAKTGSSKDTLRQSEQLCDWGKSSNLSEPSFPHLENEMTVPQSSGT